jgi:hypothetical protein
VARTKGKLEFNSAKHCGAKNGGGQPCCKSKGWGTAHLGEGKCKLHGGASTGPKTIAGKTKVAQNAVTHGLYGSILKGRDLARLQKVREYSNGEILQSNFEMLHAKLMGAVDGDVKIPKRFEKIYALAEMMADQEEFDINDLPELKEKLSGMDIEAIARISVTASGLASAARSCFDDGNIVAQNRILREFMVNVLRQSQDSMCRQMAVNAIARMKLDAGLPAEELQSLISDAKQIEAGDAIDVTDEVMD